MIVLITLEINIIDHQYNLASWSLFLLEKTKGIR